MERIEGAETRIFIGGLDKSVTKAALQTLLKPFGEAVEVRRHVLGFAHVSLAGVERAGIERCVHTLNRTKWRGSNLRVERAREHYSARLAREWDERKRSHVDDDHAAAAEDKDKDKEGEVGGRGRFSWKGKRRRFDDVDESATELRAAAVEYATRDHVMAEHMSKEGVEKSGAQRVKPRRPSAVASTLQLFGVATSAVGRPSAMTATATTTAMTAGAAGHEKDGTHATVHTEQAAAAAGQKKQVSAERVRDGDSVTMDLARAEAMGENTHLIDLSLERSAALSIMHAMFSPTAVGVGMETETGTDCRRRGLFRRLMAGTPAMRETGAQPVGTAHGDVSTLDESAGARRAGLYRKLVIK